MRRLEIVSRVLVVVAAHAGLDRGMLDIEAVRGMTGRAAERLVMGLGAHRQAGHRRRHRAERDREAAGETHAVTAGEKAASSGRMAGRADVVARLVDPMRGDLAVCLRHVAVGAGHAGPGVERRLPFFQDRGIGRLGGDGRRQRRPVERQAGALDPGGACRAAVDDGDLRDRLERDLVQVLGEEILVERAVVVEVMTAGRGAAVEREALMARPVLEDRLVAFEAIVAGQGQPHRKRDAGPVLLVAGDAVARVERGDAVGVAGIGELGAGMAVVFAREIVAVAFHAGVLQQIRARRTGWCGRPRRRARSDGVRRSSGRSGTACGRG